MRASGSLLFLSREDFNSFYGKEDILKRRFIMTKFEKFVKHIDVKKRKVYASMISYFAFKTAECEPDPKERDMLLYKAHRYGQYATRML